MPKTANKQGYTIVETMIFLAVSGMMFVVAAGFINGKQAHAEFQQGMNDINSKLQKAINDVSNGYYPSNDNVSCSIAAATLRPHVVSNPGKLKGTNQDCVFMGKLFEFKAGGDDQMYKVTTLLGVKTPPSGSASDTPSNYLEAKTSLSDSDLLNETAKLQWGLSVYKMSSSSYSNSGSVGILRSFASGSKSSGSQSIITAPINHPLDGLAVVNSDLDLLDHEASNPTAEIICFKGSNGQFGTVTLGGTGQRISTTIKIGTNDPMLLDGCH